MFFPHTSSILLFRNIRSSYYQVLISLVALILILFLCKSNVYSAQATLSWNPNSESDLAGYKVYYGNSSGSYSSTIDAGNQTSYTISNLVEGEIYFFAATAYDFSGNESGYSNEVSYDVPITSLPDDTTPPAITSVSADSAEQVVVVFSEPVEELSATNALNYGINNGIMIYTASLGSDQKTVTLTTSPHSGGDYVLTVNNIEDRASIPNVIAVDTTVGYNVPITNVDTTPPAITSVGIDSAEQVVVVFSEPVEESRAMSDFNYSINNGIMIYTALLGSDQKTVTLTTSSHSGGDYVLTVNNIEDLASIPNVIAVDTTVSYTFSNQLQITNLNVASGKAYQIVVDGLQNGARAYVDRKYKYSAVPAELNGATYIKTANSDNKSKAVSFLTFDVNQDVTVYVAHDDRITTKPSWLASFTDTGNNLVTTNTTLSMFASYYSAGTVTLGDNQGGRKTNMYTVVIVGQ